MRETEKDKMILSSQQVELAESDTYITLKNRLCYYGEPNLNGVILPVESAEEKAQTLLNMPVVAAYTTDSSGNPDLKGHEMYMDMDTGEIKFGTENVGTHTDVEIRDDTVEIGGVRKTLPCLFATVRIWKERNQNIVAAIKRLYDEHKLTNSWEILSTAFTYKDGYKTLDDYEFTADCMLGSEVSPAYGSTATTLSIASIAPVSIISEAVKKDLAARQEEEEKVEVERLETAETEVEQAEVETVEEPEQTEVLKEQDNAEAEVLKEEQETAEETNTAEEETAETEAKTEVSALTIEDLWDKLIDACRQKFGQWCYISFMFPEEHEVWCMYDSESQLDMLKFTYSVEGDEVIVSEPEKVVLTYTVREQSAKVAEKDEAIIEAGKTISELKAQVEELSSYKEEIDRIKAEREAAERAQAIAELKSFALESGQITENELNEGEIAEMLERLDENGIKAVIADRLVASLKDGAKTKKTEASVERASVETDDDMTAFEAVSAYIKNNKRRK